MLPRPPPLPKARGSGAERGVAAGWGLLLVLGVPLPAAPARLLLKPLAPDLHRSAPRRFLQSLGWPQPRGLSPGSSGGPGVVQGW